MSTPAIIYEYRDKLNDYFINCPLKLIIDNIYNNNNIKLNELKKNIKDKLYLRHNVEKNWIQHNKKIATKYNDIGYYEYLVSIDNSNNIDVNSFKINKKLLKIINKNLDKKINISDIISKIDAIKLLNKYIFDNNLQCTKLSDRHLIKWKNDKYISIFELRKKYNLN